LPAIRLSRSNGRGFRLPTSRGCVWRFAVRPRSGSRYEAQQRDLKAVGGTKIAEQVSSVAERAQLNAAIDYLREGDVLVATKLDRLVRSMRHLLEMADRIKEEGASLRILGMSLDTETATGTMILQALGAVAEHERSLMLERQREGIAKAKAEGKFKGAEL